jgi:hypothetical protein
MKPNIRPHAPKLHLALLELLEFDQVGGLKTRPRAPHEALTIGAQCLAQTLHNKVSCCAKYRIESDEGSMYAEGEICYFV